MKTRIVKGIVLFLVCVFLISSPVQVDSPDSKNRSEARRAKVNFLIDAFLSSKDKTINTMVGEIMVSPRGVKLIDDVSRALEGHREGNNLELPLKIEGLMVPAGHGYEYKVDVSISNTDKFICVSIHGDTEPEGDSEDPSCWDRAKVIIRCVISVLRQTGLNIREERAVGIEDLYWFNYYYTPVD